MGRVFVLSAMVWLCCGSVYADEGQALRDAAEKGDVQTVSNVLEQGAAVDAKSASGTTALMCAAYAGKLNVVKLLLQKGAGVNEIDNQGGTALMTAAAKGRYSVVEHLIGSGADLRLRNSDSRDALALATKDAPRAQRLRVVQLLIERGCDPNTKDKNDHTSLMNAAQAGDIDTVKYLVEKGADVNAVDRTKKCARDFAQLFGIADREAVIEYLEARSGK